MMNNPLVTLTNVLAAIAPYFTFMEYHDYPYATSEAILYFLLFASIGLLAGLIAVYAMPKMAVIITTIVMLFSYDLQFNSSFSSKIIVIFYVVSIVLLLWKLKENGYKICIAALGAFIASTLIVGVEDDSSIIHFAKNDQKIEKTSDKPIIVHIMLDEHIGLEGVPETVPGASNFVQGIRSQYEKQGYTLFGNAFSEHSYTHLSMAMAMNNVETIQNELGRRKDVLQLTDRNLRLTQNAYFKEMSKRGYRIFVRQSSYLDFCGTKDVNYARCQTYDFRKLEGVAETNIPITSKLSMFISFHTGNMRVRKVLFRAAKAMEATWYSLTGNDGQIRKSFFITGRFSWERPWIGALSHAHAFDFIGDDILKASPGDLFFAHLLQPHFPYVYDANCNIRPPSKWIHRGTNPHFNPNDQALRARIYKGYFANALCVNKKIEKFTERLSKAGILDKVAIVIHSDHGSRILFDKLKKNELENPLAHKEAHSTLFAVRIPGEKAPYREKAASIRALLWELIANGFSQVPADKDRGEQTILVPAHKENTFTRTKYLGVTSPEK